MKKFAVLGNSLQHTMSPYIHTRLFELSGVEAEYEVCELDANGLRDHLFYLKGLSGFNVTIPHKVEIIQYLDSLDEQAKLFRSVNVVKCGERMMGYNTDVYGFTRSISDLKGDLAGNVLLLGAGGVGRMMAIEVLTRGGTLTVAVRNEDSSRTMELLRYVREVQPNANVNLTTLDQISGQFDLMINSTPVGMYPNCLDCPVTDEVVANCDVVFDAVYNPVETMLYRKAKALGKRVGTGMDMLVWQAARAHKIWYNGEFSEVELQLLIEDCKHIVNAKFNNQ